MGIAMVWRVEDDAVSQFDRRGYRNGTEGGGRHGIAILSKGYHNRIKDDAVAKC